MTVTNPQGATLPGIHVEALGVSDRSGDTNAIGQMNFPRTRAGTYRVRFSGERVITFEKEVVLRAGRIADVDVTLNAAPPPPEPPPPPPPPPPEPVAPRPPPVGPAGEPVVEPIARSITPWWSLTASRIEEAGGRADEWRFPVDLPPRLRLLDKAAGLDHRELTARSRFTVQACLAEPVLWCSGAWVPVHRNPSTSTRAPRPPKLP